MNRMTILAATVLLAVAGAEAQTSSTSQASLQATSQTSSQNSSQSSSQNATTSGAQAAVAVQSQTSTSSQSSASNSSQAPTAKSSSNASSSNSANASAQVGQNQIALSEGSTINANFANSLDAGKNKPGDRVEAKTTQDVKQAGKVVIPKGTRLVGHVTQAQAHTKSQSQSQLGVVFDYAEMRDGQHLALGNMAIQALAVSQSSAQSSAFAAEDNAAADLSSVGTVSAPVPHGGGLAGGGLVGGTLQSTSNTVGNVAGGVSHAGAGAGSTLNTATHSEGAIGGLNSAGTLTSNSQGVFGLQGMSMDTAASNATQGSMIVSAGRNVHLDSGTQMLLRANAQAH
jgi:hypothetical protein